MGGCRPPPMAKKSFQIFLIWTLGEAEPPPRNLWGGQATPKGGLGVAEPPPGALGVAEPP
jgi:hypothetical protein